MSANKIGAATHVTHRMGSPKTSTEEQFRQETNFDGKFERSVVATAVYPLKRAQCSPI